MMRTPLASSVSSGRYLATNLGVVLQDRGIKLVWLARKLGISRGQMSHIIKRERSVDPDTAQRIADVLAVPLFLLFEFSTEPKLLSPRDHNGKEGHDG